MCDNCNPECKTETEPRIVTGGYWIWWCTVHNQPLQWCMTDYVKKREEALQNKVEKLKETFKIAYTEAILSDNITSITEWARKYVTGKQ